MKSHILVVMVRLEGGRTEQVLGKRYRWLWQARRAGLKQLQRHNDVFAYVQTWINK